MDVTYGLTRVAACVHHETIALITHAFAGGDFLRSVEQRRKRGRVAAVDIVHRCDVLLRNDEDVDRRLRMQVAKRDHTVIIIHDVGGNLVCRDATENAVAHSDLITSSPPDRNMSHVAMATPRIRRQCSASSGEAERMRSEVEAHARRVLAQEPTRSLSASRLRERLVSEVGDVVPSTVQLLKDLSEAPGFVVLEVLSGAEPARDDEPWAAEYANALRIAAVDSGARILLTDGNNDDKRGGACDLVTKTIAEFAATSMPDPELQRELNDALRSAEEFARLLNATVEHVVTETAVTEDSSTIPPRDPPSAPKSPRRAPRRSSRPLPPAEYR